MIIDRAQVALSIIVARADPTMSAVERVIDRRPREWIARAAAHRLR